jgi:regulator of replication initiation timing
VCSSTGKSAYKCDNCKKLTGLAENEHSLAIGNEKESLTTELQGKVSGIMDKVALSVQLDTVSANGICTMEMVQSLIKMVSKLCDEVQQLRIDNADMKTQLRELQQLPSHAPSTRSGAPTPAIATNATAKSYRDVVCAEGGNPSVDKVAATVGIPLPEAPIVTGDDFVTVVRKKRFTRLL